MTFVYPAIITKQKNGEGFHAIVPDLECCEADGIDIEDVIDKARDQIKNWINLELEDKESSLPEQTHIDDIILEEGSLKKNVMVTMHISTGYY